MICRLCFVDLKDSIDIFISSVNSNNHEVVLLIKKYLLIELKPGDPVSSKICKTCWSTLRDFHEFYRMVTEKQQGIQLKTEATEWIEAWQAPEVQLIEIPKEAVLEECDTLGDVKDETLCEPIIDANLHGYNNECHEATDTNTIDENNDKASECASDDSKSKTKNCEDVTLKAKKCLAKKRLDAQASKTTKSRRQNTKTTKALTSPPLTRKLRMRLRVIDAETIPTATAEETPAKRKVGRPRLKSVQTPTAESRAKFDRRMRISTDLDKYINENVKLDCAVCKVPLKDFGELKRHFRTEHNCVGYAMCCNNRYRKRSLYVDHLCWHKDPEYFYCDQCKKTFVSRNCLRLHNLRYHTEEMTHECKLCPKRFAKGFMLTQHMRVHLADRERTEQCKHCDKTFRTPHELRAHVRRMHDESNAPIICDICGANFRTKQNFHVHKRAVHHEGPQLPEVQCPVCARWLRDENSLRKHMYFHRESDQPGAYKCNECGAVKSSRHKLTFHIRYHHSKRYKCTLCEKEFKQSVTLTEHMATHTGVDLYGCPFCERTFKSHANMHNHKKKMHPDQWVRKYSVPSRPTEEIESGDACDSTQNPNMEMTKKVGDAQW